jgi:hypothetical protein
MALFTDGAPCGIEDLSAQDSQLMAVANSEGIDLTQKLRLAHEELGLELQGLLTRLSGRAYGLSLEPSLDSVAVTPAVKLWHAFRTLELAYADAYSNQLNDRYAGKRDQFHERARWAKEKMMQNGVGMVRCPVPKPAVPALGTAPGAMPDGTYYLTMAWVNPGGEEGACADTSVVNISSSTLTVQVGTNDSPAPRNASGWNVYIGQDPDHMTSQNAIPIPVNGTWVQPNAVGTSGRRPGTGQRPDILRPVPRVIPRG